MQIFRKIYIGKKPNPNGPLSMVFCAFVGVLFVFGANAVSVVDIIQQADGTYEVFADGVRHATASTPAMAQEFAGRFRARGSTINWSSASKTTVNANALTAKTSSNALTTTAKTSSNALTTTAKTSSNALTTTAKTSSNALTTTAKTSSNALTTTTKTGPNVSATTGGKGTPPPKTTPNPAPSVPKVNVAGLAMGAVGMVSGALVLDESVKSKDTKATWADVGTGAMGGMTFATGTAAVVNAIPIGGQIAYGAAVAVGTIVGATGAGAKMFSETDCEKDPVTGQYACCNVSKLTNIQARLVNIGDEMFGTFPYVRTCMQGENKFESNWVKARFLDDHWSKEGEVKFCSGWQMPENGDYNIQAYGSSEAKGKVCWQWECADKGFVRSGAKCVKGGGQVVVPGAKVGEPCPNDKLPHNATAGKYIRGSGNSLVCAATKCKKGTYLVKNEKGVSQGWCKAGVAPAAPVATGADETVPVADGAPENVGGDAPVVQLTPCEQGMSGWILFEGACITDVQHNQILSERQAARVRELTGQINNVTSQLDVIASGFKVSVWKDKDGKFNTARLASDSIAGVVLGTAGGLITSNIVKKNQVEDGFEDIRCVIGGQSVANWGDEFTVGIQ